MVEKQQSPDYVLQLMAPVAGVVVDLSDVPDPVFSQRIMGDGVAIDPVSSLVVAPCDATVIDCHRAQHALTLKTSEGIEIILHVGLDTVLLAGDGFDMLVQAGEVVSTGQPLLRFDQEKVSAQARSLLTIMIVLSENVDVSMVHKINEPVEVNSVPLLSVVSKAILNAFRNGKTQQTDAEKSESHQVAVTVRNPQGLHARPIALLVQGAKQFSCDVIISKGEQKVNGRSMVALLGLEVGYGDVLTVHAVGSKAKECVLHLVGLIEQKLGEETSTTASTKQKEVIKQEVDAAEPQYSNDPRDHVGIEASSGLALGRVHQIRDRLPDFSEKGQGVEAELECLARAKRQVTDDLLAIRANLMAQGQSKEAAIFESHIEMLDDPEIAESVKELICLQHMSAPHALHTVTEQMAQQLRDLKTELLNLRADDLLDVARRMIRVMVPDAHEPEDLPADAILVAEALSPSDTINLHGTNFTGLCTITGGTVSHVAILARSLGIPALINISESALHIPNGTPALLDTFSGTLRVNPTVAEREALLTRQRARAEAEKIELAQAVNCAETQDGEVVQVLANIGGLSDAERAVSMGADGVGLLRSEFVFMERKEAPDEQEQYDIYQNIIEVLCARPVVVRTLDVGGDKPLSYLQLDNEANPFLGERGVRVGLRRPQLLRTQLRALLQAAQQGTLSIMLPMVTHLSEWQQVKAMIDELRNELAIDSVPIGMMIEVPSAALLADQFAKEVDFFSIGTNDLAQYVCAIDRGHPILGDQVDGLHPAVLRLIAMTIQAAAQHDVKVSVCGDIASDLLAVPILLGLGIRDLSAVVTMVPGVKTCIRQLHSKDCEVLAQRALSASNAQQVRDMAEAFLDEKQVKVASLQCDGSGV